MASIRNLKKDINYVLGDIIDAALVWQVAHPEQDPAATEAIVDDAINSFDNLITQVNNKKVESRKASIKEVQNNLETEARTLIGRINAL